MSIVRSHGVSVRMVVIAVMALLGALLIFSIISAFGPSAHYAGGCNYVPLVNGQPAYPCNMQLH